MKVKNTTSRQSMLLKLKLIKTKIYVKKNIIVDLKVEDIESRLKKGLQVIFKYHAIGKKILFVGKLSCLERAMMEKLLANTKHVFMPEYQWFNGTILNKQLSVKSSRLRSKIHLVVVLNCLIKSDIVAEVYKAKIPTVVLSNYLNIFNDKFSYKILGNFWVPKQKMEINFFFMLLQSFLKKPNKSKIEKKIHYKKNRNVFKTQK